MRINYTLDENNVIVEWHSSPIDLSKPYIDVDSPIVIGVDKVVKGNFIKVSNDAYIARIAELKSLLASTDYLCLKHADGALTDAEYEDMRIQRQAWRDEINELEKE